MYIMLYLINKLEGDNMMKNNNNNNNNSKILFMGGILIMFSLYLSVSSLSNSVEVLEPFSFDLLYSYFIFVVTRLILSFQVIPFLIGVVLCVRSFRSKN